jgi:hypothetical protein
LGNTLHGPSLSGTDRKLIAVPITALKIVFGDVGVCSLSVPYRHTIVSGWAGLDPRVD